VFRLLEIPINTFEADAKLKCVRINNTEQITLFLIKVCERFSALYPVEHY